MPNPYFNATGNPINSSEVASDKIRDEFSAIAAGFNKLPALTGNAYKITYINAAGTAIDVVGGAGLLLLSTTGIPSVQAMGAGIATFLGTPSSANLAAAVTGKTGTGALVFAESPTLVTPALGTPSALVGTNITGTAAGLTAGAASAVAVGGITGLGTGVATALAVNVGSAGAPVVNGGDAGTPSALVGTNITGTAAGLTAGAASAVAVGGITGLGAGVATALAVNVGSAGAPVVNGGELGTPSSGDLSNCTGYPGGITLGTPQASTSGTAITFTGLTGSKRITIMGVGVSTNGTSPLMCQIGDAGGSETTGYVSSTGKIAASTNYQTGTAGFLLSGDGTEGASDAMTFKVVLDLQDPSDNTWVYSSHMILSGTAEINLGCGHKALSAELDRVSITTVAGSATFDAGEINISYE